MQAKKILMFSDEMVMPNIIGNILSDELKSEYKILLTTDNFQQKAEDYEPNLIMVTSCSLISLISRLKASKNTKDIPIVLLSGALSREEGESYAPDAFLSKPVNIEILLSTVMDILSK